MTHHRPLVIALVLTFTSLYLALFLITIRSEAFSLPGGLVISPLLAGLWFLSGRSLSRQQTNPQMTRIVFWSVPVHLIAALVRLGTETALYGRLADANLYLVSGAEIAGQIWSGRSSEIDFRLGTRAMEVVTGVVFSVVGPTTLGGFVAFSALAWFGLYLFLRAFQLMVPDGDHVLYGRLVMFLPTLLFWPSAIGKDPWLVLCLGLATWGAAVYFASGRVTAAAILGVAGAVLVRPHMAMLFLAAVGAAFVLTRASDVGPLAKAAGAIVLVLGGVVVASQVQSFFNLDALTVDSLVGVADRVDANTVRGGSQFGNASVRSIFLLPLGVLFVTLRPFPWEAGNLLALAVSFEGVGMVLMAWQFRDRILSASRQILSNPYFVLCSVFTLEFVIAFSNFNNLGLLSRERSQLLPFLVVVLAVRRKPSSAHSHRQAAVASV